VNVVSITTLPPPFGGVTVLLKELTLALARLDVRQTLITQRSYDFEVLHRERATYPHGPDAHADLRGLGVAMHPLYDYTLESRWRRRGLNDVDPDLCREVSEILENERPDLVSCQFPSGAFREAARAARAADIPFVLTLHNLTSLLGSHGSLGLRGLSADEVIALLRQSAQGIVVSAEMLAHCRDQGLRNVSVIPGGVDLEAFRPAAGITRRGILYVGRTLTYKGLREICEAYVIAEQDLPDDPLDLVGTRIDQEAFERTGFWLEGARRERLAGLIAQGRVRLHGEVQHDRIAPYYQRARVFGLPSLVEGFPISILEALACGAPVIASDVGGVAAVVRDGWNGYLAPAGAIERVADALRRVGRLEDGTLAARCRESAQGFSIARTAQRHLELFRSLIA
jgi:glycosyltransferase involved in cell wall biosynthesis